MTTKILFVGDMHLGRRPSRLPPSLAARAESLGPGGAWRRVLEFATTEQVTAVALAGDLVERENDFFEAYRELQHGVETLARAGIRVVGIAGNHDVLVLPRLADQVQGFHLLGRGGRWESISLGAGADRLTLWGWSFPQRQVERSPLEGMRFEVGHGLNLGLLHCDRDQARSPYAPVMSRELAAAGLDGWLLGHVHSPDELRLPRPTGYLGSVTGLDPGEPGARGPWLMTVERGQITALEQQVLAPLRWEALDVELGGILRPEEAQDRLLERLRALDEMLGALPRPPDAVGLRVRLVGRTRHGQAAERLFPAEVRESVPVGGSRVHYFIEKLTADTRPEVDLATLAARNDPLGLLAQRLLLLDGEDDSAQRRALISTGRSRLEAAARDSRWQELEPAPMDDEAIAEALRRAATRLLENMLAQLEHGP